MRPVDASKCVSGSQSSPDPIAGFGDGNSALEVIFIMRCAI